MHQFFIKLEKLHSEPILCPFWPKNFETKFSPKKSILVNFEYLRYCNLQKFIKRPNINIW